MSRVEPRYLSQQIAPARLRIAGGLVIPGEGNDVSQRTCTIDGCERSHLARGMCSSHYGAWHRRINGRTNNRSSFEIRCIVCGASHLASRPEAKFCSDVCKGQHYSATMRRKSKLPVTHPVMLLIAEAKAAAKVKRVKPRVEWRTARECPGCACRFTPIRTPNAICCSARCARKVAKRRRRAREHGALGSWTWAQFMRIAKQFDYCCAYCGEKPDRLDPDHVRPLARGGFDSPANLLPTCLMCNSSKGSMTLTEWAAWLSARDLPPRATTWSPDDRRYWHLTQAHDIAPAA